MGQTDVIPIWLPEYDWLDDDQFLISTHIHSSGHVHAVHNNINNNDHDDDMSKSQDELSEMRGLKSVSNCVSLSSTPSYSSSTSSLSMLPTMSSRSLNVINNSSPNVSVERTKTFTRRSRMSVNGNTIEWPRTIVRRGTFRCRPEEQSPMSSQINLQSEDAEDTNSNKVHNSANESIMNRTFTKDMFGFESSPSPSTPILRPTNPRRSFIIKPSPSSSTRIPKPGPKM